MADRATYWVLGGLTALLCGWFFATALTLDGAYVAPEEIASIAGGAGPSAFVADRYRLFSASLAHLNVMHLCGNLVLLWVAGLSLGRLSHPGLLLISFMVAGPLGTTATLFVSGGWVLGASAGVFGIFGALIGQFCRQRGPVGAVQGVILGGLILVVASLGHGDILAHWCGFFAGVWLGLFVWSDRMAWIGTYCLLVVTAAATIYHWSSV